MNMDLYKEYEKLLLTRDAKEREAGAYRTAYIKEFGELMNRSFEIKLDCIKKKKTISFCQMYANCGEKLNLNDMQRYIDKEMDYYNKQLQEMILDYNGCKQAGVSTELEVIKSKTIYRILAKRLHPDMNPQIAENEELSELWNRVVLAYHQNDVDKLNELEVLCYAALERWDFPESMPEIENVEEKIQEVKDTIERIITTDPYQYSLLLDNVEAVKQKKQDLQSEIDEYTRYAKELEEVIQNFMKKGVVMIWQTN